MKKIMKDGLIHKGAILNNSMLGNYCEIGKESLIQNTQMGDYSYCGERCIFQNVLIKKFSNIAACVRIGATDHPMERASLHHFSYRSSLYDMGEDDAEFFRHRFSRVTTIGHDTWIGHGALIKPGIDVGHGAVIGQGSVVTKNIPAFAIVAGNPAKILRFRFDERIIQQLLDIAWWDWSHETLKSRLMDFRKDVRSFIDIYGRLEK